MLSGKHGGSGVNSTRLYVTGIGAAAGLLQAYRSWPSGEATSDQILSTVVMVLASAGVAYLIAWLVTRNRFGSEE